MAARKDGWSVEYMLGEIQGRERNLPAPIPAVQKSSDY
jgi:hypothetical protein